MAALLVTLTFPAVPPLPPFPPTAAFAPMEGPPEPERDTDSAAPPVPPDPPTDCANTAED